MNMWKIAVCDDNIPELSNVISIINEYKEINVFRYEIEYTAFDNAVDLISAVEGGERYHIILLDIVMPLVNGMEAAHEIRIHDNAAQIIFLTSSTEFAVDSYAVGAFYYALKPIWKEKLFSILDKAYAEIDSQNGQSLLVKCKTGLTRIPLHTLEYIEIMSRTISYHLVSGIVLEGTGVMGELGQVLLTYPQFAKPHRAFIVNMDCIHTLSLREIKMCSHAIIPVAKAIYSDFKASYIARSFKRGSEV